MVVGSRLFSFERKTFSWIGKDKCCVGIPDGLGIFSDPRWPSLKYRVFDFEKKSSFYLEFDDDCYKFSGTVMRLYSATLNYLIFVEVDEKQLYDEFGQIIFIDVRNFTT